MNKDGSEKKEIIKLKEEVNYCQWSPDSKQILCSKGSDAAEELIIVSVKDGTLMQLTHNNVRDTYPSWSPDGKKILFVSALDGDLDIYYIKLKN